MLELLKAQKGHVAEAAAAPMLRKAGAIQAAAEVQQRLNIELVREVTALRERVAALEAAKGESDG